MAHILKFGGSSVSNFKAIKNVKNIINNADATGGRTAVVVSAFYGVTNKLIEAMEFAKKGDIKLMKNNLSTLQVSHKIMSSELNVERETIDYIFDSTNRSFQEILDTKKIKANNYDNIVSIGEKLSASIISSSEDKYKYTGDVIITNNNYGNSYPIMNATKEKWQNNYDKIPIIPGFFGHTINGKVTTMGRGGSDLTATVIANCIGAKDISFYKVECNNKGDWQKGLVGIVHPNKETISHLSFNEMHEMGNLGRTVLHKSTIKPIKFNRDLTIHIKNTLEPAKAGTKITLDGPKRSRAAPFATMMNDPGSNLVHLIGNKVGSYDQHHIINVIGLKYQITYKSEHSITLKVSSRDEINEIFNLYLS